MYKMLSVFNFSYVTEALCQEVTKNLNLAFGMVQADDKPKVFKKASYIGRRILVSSHNLKLIIFSYRVINQSKLKSNFNH